MGVYGCVKEGSQGLSSSLCRGSPGLVPIGVSRADSGNERWALLATRPWSGAYTEGIVGFWDRYVTTIPLSPCPHPSVWPGNASITHVLILTSLWSCIRDWHVGSN
jgi:hypothetical protein